MATLPDTPLPAGATRPRIFGKARLTCLFALLALFILCVVFSFTTRDSMANLPFLAGHGKTRSLAVSQKTLVDSRPWQTAETLAPLAVTAEETRYAHEAERLADHEVDQAFAAALRLASAQVRHRTLSGEALALSQNVARLQQLVKDDQALVQSLTHASSSPADAGKAGAQPAAGDDDLDIAKAQLGLDSDQLDDVQQELDRASGDVRAQIQGELAAHEAAMRKYDSESHANAPTAVYPASQHGTLAGRIKAWNDQRDRNLLIQQALAQAQADIASLTAEHKDLEAQANARTAATGADAPDRAARVADIKERAEQSQILSICNDRIQTQQQLAAVYGKWSNQVLLQHRIMLHLVLQSLALIAFVLICVVLGDALVRRLTELEGVDRRRMQTLRSILQLCVQLLGGLIVLFVVIGWPTQVSTVVGLATAGLTIAMQDFIIAFFGWFVLMGRNGIRVGDWVEINGVGGEVTEIGLMSTTLLETGNLAETGRPTGRRITIINSFAIRGQYFNFSTSGQWMWDEIKVGIALSAGAQAMAERIQKAVLKETEENTRLAEQEWKRGARSDGLSRFSAVPVVNLRPSSSGIDISVRYVTRASERFAVRNRLYQDVIDLLQKPDPPAHADQPRGVAEA